MQQAIEHVAFKLTIMGFAVHFEDFAEQHAGCGFDLAIDFDKTPAQFFGDCSPHGRLTGATYAE